MAKNNRFARESAALATFSIICEVAGRGGAGGEFNVFDAGLSSEGDFCGGCLGEGAGKGWRSARRLSCSWRQKLLETGLIR